ncbi:hypothetical protein EVAR_65066_1 [Eumeta japonica]|uniref:Uncharacterized protein n=1 Tax=Eumeta variegata TaxID=151549 RepID=A0A4C1ZRS4_EUMVA|nr:hypothetical protein EVAR_65066_1 [Eumeta japonica]
METMYDHYDEIQLQLECKDDMDARLSERNDFESIYYKALSKVHGMLTDYSKSAEQANSASFRASICCKSDKLPTIQLPKFSGAYGNWLEFRGINNANSHIGKMCMVSMRSLDENYSSSSSSSSLNLQPVAMTERDKSRYTEGSVNIGGSVGSSLD